MKGMLDQGDLEVRGELSFPIPLIPCSRLCFLTQAATFFAFSIASSMPPIM